ncbi:hypothetical protein CFC21_012745 [Triticum aestivum]|uniref:RING-type domain-containing protein n=2 Tax=Triticum aestivum TaxID=4565 RepID=A0A9R1DR36_WHEAT|nr:RING-H2 finger protein ATL74-like [Aegilops tauschii subsp. strangulata]XP_044433434.1 RING-H2 finger protein ATL74-like [Triticum aestivum]KAF6996401.1 hypothetical protein CFC21_012745 [Triticum aestivum]
MGRLDSEAPTSSIIAAGLTALHDHAHGHGGGAAAPTSAGSAFDTNVVIILAALFFALLFAIGLNSLARCALRHVGRGAAVAAGEGGATARAAFNGSGIKRRVLRSLPVEVYGSGEVIDDVCAICLGEFVDGEKVRVLPECCHGFHVRCVDAWLVSHSSCPTCRRPVIEDSLAKGGEANAAVENNTITVVIV